MLAIAIVSSRAVAGADARARAAPDAPDGPGLPAGPVSPASDDAPAAATKRLGAHVTSTKAWARGFVSRWTERGFDDRGWLDVRGPVVPRGPFTVGGTPPAGATATDVRAGASLLLRTSFDVSHPEAARVIDLRVMYLDGFVAFMNGVEIARRNLPALPAGAQAPTPHGAEPERIFIPLDARSPALLARDNLLAVEIRPAYARLPIDLNAPAGEASVALASGVRLVRGPYLIAPGEGAVSVAWETDLPARGTLVVDAGPGDGRARRRLPARTAALRQVVRASDLEPGSRVRYRVEIEGERAGDRDASAPAWFETAPRPNEPMRFVVYGDMRAPGHAAHAQVVAGIMRERPALVLNTGDLVASGGEESAWQRYFEITAPLGAIAPVVPALGNHEAYLDGSAKSWRLFGLRSASAAADGGYTSFDWGGAHFLILDSNRLDRSQRDWVEADLAAARKRRVRAIFAISHEGAWSHGAHGGNRTLERDFAPALAAGNVDVWFAGHDHLYERGVGVTARGPLRYVVTGGGGAPLYNPTCRPRGARPAGPAFDDPPPEDEGNATDGASSSSEMLPVCPAWVAIIRKAHHYVAVELAGQTLRLCPRAPDGEPLEPCVEMPLRAHAADGEQPGAAR